MGKRASKLSFNDLRNSIGQNLSRQGLHTHTKKEGFHRRSKGGDFGLRRLPTRATTLQEVGILPTWFISNLMPVLR